MLNKYKLSNIFSALNTVYQFHGCWWHGCECKTGDRDDTTKGPSLNQKRERTKKSTEYIRSCGYTVIEMWECEWREYKRSNTIHNSYVYPTEHIFRMNEREILANIMACSMFGVVEVDIEVPENLKEHFQEMPPIFKNITIQEQDIGEHMSEFLRSSNKTFKDTRYLIGSMFATKILLITPLLRWYIQHGLVVTKIYQFIEFSPKKAFLPFEQSVTNDRRAGDRDPAYKVIADTSKLIGNSFYGYTIMNKSKHLSVKFCTHDEASKLINDPRFMSIDEFEDDCFEVIIQIMR